MNIILFCNLKLKLSLIKRRNNLFILGFIQLPNDKNIYLISVDSLKLT